MDQSLADSLLEDEILHPVVECRYVPAEDVIHEYLGLQMEGGDAHLAPTPRPLMIVPRDRTAVTKPPLKLAGKILFHWRAIEGDEPEVLGHHPIPRGDDAEVQAFFRTVYSRAIRYYDTMTELIPEVRKLRDLSTAIAPRVSGAL